MERILRYASYANEVMEELSRPHKLDTLDCAETSMLEPGHD